MLPALVAADNSIHEAVSSWLDEEARQGRHGDISVWDTSEVTDMANFCAHVIVIKEECGRIVQRQFERVECWRCLICCTVSVVLPPLSRRHLPPPFFQNLTRAFSLLAVFPAEKFDSDVSKWDVAKVSTMSYSKYSLLPPLSRRRLAPRCFYPDTCLLSPRSVLLCTQI